MDGHKLWLSQCQSCGFAPEARMYEEGTRTSQDAANQLGCDVSHIAKSVVFEGPERAVVVIASGANRVDRKRKLKKIIGFKPGIASPEYVKQSTGYAVGGVPPFGHTKPVDIIMDEDLMEFELVWGAAGTAQTVFPIEPSNLQRISKARLADIKQ